MVSQEESLLSTIVVALVDNPSDVKVEKTTDEMGVLLSISLNPADMGKVIGREGATAKAIRAIMRAVGMNRQARINVKIVEPEGRQKNYREEKEVY
jgi:hypothetical protein